MIGPNENQEMKSRSQMMYEYIKGKLVFVGPLYVVLENGGIGYQLQVAHPFRFSGSLNQDVTFYI